MNRLGKEINNSILVSKKLAGAKLITHKMELVLVYLLLMF